MNKTEKPASVYWLDSKLYLNITNRCSNSCYFCLRNFKRGVGGFNLKLAGDPTLEEVTRELEDVLAMRSWAELVFCGFGEPTERLDALLAVTRWVRQHNGRPLRIRVNTNGHGFLLNPGRDVAKEMKGAGVDSVSVSLNAGDEETYNEVCKPTIEGSYGAVLEFIQKAKPFLEVEVTAVRMPEVDLGKAKEAADRFGVQFRIRECIQCFY